ncbi:MAG: hypothetical protein AB7N76_09195 [Planctomycetota bacterium]
MLAVEALKQRLAALDTEALDGLFGRELRDPLTWTRTELETLLQVADQLEALDRRLVRIPMLPDELAVAVFCGPEPTARWSWAGAAARLGMTPLLLGPEDLGPGLTRAGALAAMNAHALGVCPPRGEGESVLLEELATGVTEYLRASFEARAVPVISLGPVTRALGDAQALREALGCGLQGLRMAVVWAGDPWRAVDLAGLVSLYQRLGMDVTLVSPHADAAREAQVARADRLDALAGANAVLWLGGEAAGWTLDEARMGATSDALLLHDLGEPVQGVAPELLQRFRGAIARQANKKTYVLMAAMALAKVKGLWHRLQELLD